jgi:hypothetical protein
MPRGNGTGPTGKGPGTGRGMGGRGTGGGRGAGRGGGMGRKGGSAMGPGGNCVCPKCGNTVQHAVGTPCYDIKCPNCGSPMTRQ